MATDYKPIDCNFYDEFEAAATQRRHVHLQYFNDLHQLSFASGVIDTLITREHAEFLRLKSGEEIRLGLVIRLDDKPSPTYADYPDFSCGC